jgi:uncharacterized membrane protein YqiK
MSEILSKFNGDSLATLCLVILIFVAFITAFITSAWVKVRRADAAAVLKHDMLNRGMSAEEIKTVLEAGEDKPIRRTCRV